MPFRFPRLGLLHVASLLIALGLSSAAAFAGGGWLSGAGGNVYGELGTGAGTITSNSGGILNPTLVIGATGATATGVLTGKTVIQASGGDDHTCFLTSDGGVFCTGRNNDGRVGDGTTIDRSVPTTVLLPSGSIGRWVAAGSDVSCAVVNTTTRKGAVYCWGSGDDALLGNCTDNASCNKADSATPVLLGGALATRVATQVSVGASHACAIADGNAYCWGRNPSGQLGYGIAADSNAYYPSPAAVLATGTGAALNGLTVKRVSAAKGNATNGHTCVIASNNSLYCWGGNNKGQLGIGSTTEQISPAAVTQAVGVLAGKTIVDITTGPGNAAGTSCAVDSDGQAYCWGDASSGNLGNGTSNGNSTVPVLVTMPSGKKAVQISLGADHGCFATADGVAYCWGGNNNGEYGDGSTTSSTTPAPAFTTGATGLGGNYVTAVATGFDHTLFVAPAGGPGTPIVTGGTPLFKTLGLPCALDQTLTAAGASRVAPSVFGNAANSTMKNFLTGFGYSSYSPSTNSGWAMFRRDATAATPAYVETLSGTQLQYDTGYWIISAEPPQFGNLQVNCDPVAPTTTVTDVQGCASANGCKVVPIATVTGDKRFNLVPNPFPYPIDWSSVRVRVNGSASTLTPSQAALPANNLISSTIWNWNGTTYITSDDTVKPGQLPYFGASWVQVREGAAGKTVELLIPKLPSGSPAPAAGGAARSAALTTGTTKGSAKAATAKTKIVTMDSRKKPGTGGGGGSVFNPLGNPWSVKLTAYDYQADRATDGILLGRAAGASSGYDSTDLMAMTPFSTPYLTIVFPHPEWTGNAGDYATDFREIIQSPATLTSWPFEIRVKPSGSTVYLKWQGDIEVLKKSEIYEVATGATYQASDLNLINNGIPVTMGATATTETKRQFIWRTKSY